MRWVDEFIFLSFFFRFLYIAPATLSRRSSELVLDSSSLCNGGNETTSGA